LPYCFKASFVYFWQKNPTSLIMKLLFSICLSALISLQIFAQDQVPYFIKKTTKDSLLISSDKRMYVKAEIISCKDKSLRDCKDCEETDTILVIKNYQGQELYKLDNNYDPEGYSELDARSIHVKEIGNILLISNYETPTVASDRGNIQLFNTDKLGKLRPITGSIALSGDFGNNDFKVHKASLFGINNQTWMIETKNFTGQCGFEIGRFYALDLNGYKGINEVFPDSVSVYAGKNNMVTIKGKKPLILNVLMAPKEGSTKVKLLLKTGMKLQLSHIVNKNKTQFVVIKANGQTYYLSSFSEYSKLGFPACD
jgi:hypothetical protein